jgi:inosine-uridine nucleoside N-ribohydrolase
VSRPVVLDTDLGSDADDALCLSLALASPELEIVGITCVGRESRRRAQITRRLLELASREEIPVYAGCRVPITGVGNLNWYGHEGGGVLEPGEEPEIEALHAVDALEMLSKRHEGLEVVAVGPMTNLAVTLAKDPDLAGRIRRLSIMGGHLRRVEYGGHVFAPGIDYNLCSDPYASYAVLRSGIPTRLVTADVTLRTWIRDADVSALERTGHPCLLAIARAVRLWTPVMTRGFAAAGCDTSADVASFLHDPLTWACAHDESFCSFADLEIETRIEDGVLRTLERPGPSDDTFPMRCAVDVDAKAFRDHFMQRVLSLAG